MSAAATSCQLTTITGMHNGVERDDSLVAFCRRLPKLEVHAHLNGSIPRDVLAELIKEKSSTHPHLKDFKLPDAHLARIGDFFDLFKIIYQITDTEESLRLITRKVIESFRDDGVVYLELRTTPRKADTMTREAYIDAVMSALKVDGIVVNLILSIDRRMNVHDAEEIVDLAIKKSVVGLDLCGDVESGNVTTFSKAFQRARDAGLKLTIHFGEIQAMVSESSDMLALFPNRLGHGTYLDDPSREIVIERRIGIEICQSSNVLTRTVTSHAQHHLGRLLQEGVPVLICTDDILVFNSTSTNEYYLAALHFNLSRKDIIQKLLLPALDVLFCDKDTKAKLKKHIMVFASSEGIKI